MSRVGNFPTTGPGAKVGTSFSLWPGSSRTHHPVAAQGEPGVGADSRSTRVQNVVHREKEKKGRGEKESTERKNAGTPGRSETP